MEDIYKYIGITRQGFHQYLQKKAKKATETAELIEVVKTQRIDHPRIGARPLHYLIDKQVEYKAVLQGVGINQLEDILAEKGLNVPPIRSFHKTTYAGARRFENLVEGLEIIDINKIWVSDITYYRLREGRAYLTFVLDLYSRNCLGYACSKTLVTEQTIIPAIKMALDKRKIKDYEDQLIFHSDGGGQFQDQGFLEILNKYNIVSSMAEIVYENPHVERFHSTAKNDYLIPWGVNSFCQLQKELPRFVELYNRKRPHSELKYKSPLEFEDFIQSILLKDRKVLTFKKVS